MDLHRERFNAIITEIATKKKDNSTVFTREKYDQLLQNLETIAARGCQTHQHYHQAKKYELSRLGSLKKVVRRGTQKFVVPSDEVFEIIHAAHIATCHGGRNVLEKELFSKYANVTREQIMRYINLCECCQLKRVKPKKGLVV